MSPEGPRFSPELDKDGKKDKKRKKNASVPLSPLIAVEQGETKQTEQKELSPLEKALADLAARRAETTTAADNAEKPEKDEKKEKAEAAESEAPDQATNKEETEKTTATLPEERSAEPIAEQEEKTGAADEKKEASEDDQSYETLPTYAPEPTEFSGGEVIIHLNGDEPVAERVIPLQVETASQDQPEEKPIPAEEKREQPIPAHPAERLRPQGAVPETAPEPAAGGGGEIPPVPPTYPRASAEQPPERPNPQEVFDAEAIRLRDMAPFAPSSERPATKQDVEDALYYAEKAGQRRGVLAGLLAGGAYEHFKHKRRERKLHKQMKQQGKELESARQDYDFGLKQQAAANAETQRRLAATEAAVALPIEKATRAEAPAPAIYVPERGPKATPSKEQAAPEPVLPEPEQLTIPPEHRLETSAWHTIEVDAHTGKPVEAPSFEYGREYHRERAHENLPDPEPEAATAAAGEPIHGGAGSDQAEPGTTDTAHIPDATKHGESVKPAKKAKEALSSVASGAASSGPLWPWLVALLVIIILLVILL